MDDDLGASEDEERTIELSSIEAIFPELRRDPVKAYTASLDLPITPIKPLKIYFQSAAKSAPPILPTPPSSNEPDGDNERLKINATLADVDVHSLSHLPPLILTINLPEGYPSTKPPIVALSTEPRWVPERILSTLAEDCKRLWEEMGRDQIVYTYIDHLQQAAETAFGIGAETDGQFELPGELRLALLDYNLKTMREKFERETFECGICLEPKKGIECHRMLLCGDVFCVPCLQDFYNNAIIEGDVDSVKCLAPGCGKDDSPVIDGKRRKRDRTLNPSELLQIPIDQEKVQRYVKLKRKKKLESDKNTIYCPRQWCQGAARSKRNPKPVDPLNDFADSDSDAGSEGGSGSQTVTGKKKKKQKPEDVPMKERIAVCEDCDFAFCSVCKKGWHGEFVVCDPRRRAELNEEEKASLEYFKRFSTPCPTCNAPSQKSMGCNHMICFKCKTHFCYLCGAYLMESNPYRHFNDFASPCYMRLWVLEEGDGAGPGHDLANGADAAPGWEAEVSDSESDSESNAESELDDEDFAEFGGEDFILLPGGGIDTDEDEEPAPDIRRANRNVIEIVNFARPGANQQFQLPERPRNQAPPPHAPNPPRRRGQGQQGNRQRMLIREPNRRAAELRPPVVAQAGAEDNAPRILPPAAPGQGNGNQQLPAPARAMGLERFIELARQDMEDEWDSDELDDDMDIVVPQPQRRRREVPRRL